nr:ATP-binding cassette domain-containing protein [Vallitalea pronyensis]
MIKVENLTKIYKCQKRKEGFGNTIKSLFKREYEEKIAVDNISFDIGKGEIIGFIGPNGAGKSTTIKMLVGILVPSKGSIIVNDLIPYKSRIENAKKIGVVFGQKTQLWWDIPVSETFNLMKYMYKIPDEQYKENITFYRDIMDLDEFSHIPVRQLSLGQRMRADFCAALLHNPEIIYLDEPTIGLDVVVKEKIREFIKEINKVRKTTVLLTTHDMSDIEKLCSRVMVIDRGKMMYDGELQQLKSNYGTQQMISIETEGIILSSQEFYKLNIINAEIKNNKALIRYDKTCINATQIISWIMKRYKIKDFTDYEADVEEIIRNMYNELRSLK